MLLTLLLNLVLFGPTFETPIYAEEALAQEKREAIKASAQAAKQSNTPSRDKIRSS